MAADKSETSLQLALESEKLAEAQKAYIDALKGAAEKEPDVVGYVFAVNGKINSGDIYASNALFRKLWPKLLKAAATEAIGAEKTLPKALDPTAAAVDEFLARRGAAASRPSGRRSTARGSRRGKRPARSTSRRARPATSSTATCSRAIEAGGLGRHAPRLAPVSSRFGAEARLGNAGLGAVGSGCLTEGVRHPLFAHERPTEIGVRDTSRSKLSHRDVIDEARLAEPGGGEHAARAARERKGRASRHRAPRCSRSS